MADVSKAEEGEKSHGKIVREEGAIAQTQDDAVKLLSRKLNNALERIESQENTINDILESQKREKEALSAKYESIFELIAEEKDRSENDDGAAERQRQVAEYVNKRVAEQIRLFAKRVAAKLTNMDAKIVGATEQRKNIEDRWALFESQVREELSAHGKDLASTKESIEGLSATIKSHARTLHDWPQQLQLVVYQPMNDLTTKLRSLQKRTNGLERAQQSTNKSLAETSAVCDETKTRITDVVLKEIQNLGKGIAENSRRLGRFDSLQETVNRLDGARTEMERVMERERGEASTRAQRLVDAQNKLRAFVLKQQAHQSEMTSAVRELQNISRGLKKRIEDSTTSRRAEEPSVESDTTEVIALKQSFEELRTLVMSSLGDIDEKTTANATEDSVSASKSDSKSCALLDGASIRDYIDRCCAERVDAIRAKLVGERREPAGNESVAVSSIRKRLFEKAESRNVAAVAPPLSSSPDSSKVERNTGENDITGNLGTPDVERVVGTILTDTVGSEDGALSGTPDVERFVGRILEDGSAERSADSTPSVEKLLGKILDDDDDDGDDNAEKTDAVVVSRHADANVECTDSLVVVRDAISALEEKVHNRATLLEAHIEQLDAMRRDHDALTASVARQREAGMREYDGLLATIQDARKMSADESMCVRREIEETASSARAFAELEAASACRSEIEHRLSAVEKSWGAAEQKVCESFHARLSEVRSAQEKHAADLDRRCGEWTKRVAKNVQSQRKRHANAIAHLEDKIARVQTETDASARSMETSEAVDRKLGQFARRQSHSLRQVQLSLEGVTKKIVSEHISHSESVENAISSIERRFGADADTGIASLRQSQAELAKRVDDIERNANATSDGVRDEIETLREHMQRTIDERDESQARSMEKHLVVVEEKTSNAMREAIDKQIGARQALKVEMEKKLSELTQSRELTYAELETTRRKYHEEQRVATTKLRDVLLEKHVRVSKRIDDAKSAREELRATLRNEMEVRTETLRKEARQWRDDQSHLEESRVCAKMSEIERSVVGLDRDVKSLSVRIDTQQQKSSQEAASLRARHVDVVDALVRTKRCQANMERTASSCRAIEEAVGRMQSRLCAAEKRMPQIEEDLSVAADGFRKSIARLSEDIGTVSCSVADLKMGFDGIAMPSLRPLVVKDPQLL